MSYIAPRGNGSLKIHGSRITARFGREAGHPPRILVGVRLSIQKFNGVAEDLTAHFDIVFLKPDQLFGANFESGGSAHRNARAERVISLACALSTPRWSCPEAENNR